MTSIATNFHSPKSQKWYRPTISPEHGVYVMLVVSFLTGVAAAQQWTWDMANIRDLYCHINPESLVWIEFQALYLMDYI